MKYFQRSSFPIHPHPPPPNVLTPGFISLVELTYSTECNSTTTSSLSLRKFLVFAVVANGFALASHLQKAVNLDTGLAEAAATDGEEVHRVHFAVDAIVIFPR